MPAKQMLVLATALTIASPAAAAPAKTENGRIVEQKTLVVDESLRKELEAQEAEGKARGIDPQPLADILATIGRVEMTDITYLSGGLRVKGFVLTPKKEGRFPVVIFNRGGCRESIGVLTKAYVARWLSVLADWGYVVVASQYRGAAGSEGKDEFGGADVDDVVNLFPLIDSLPNADASRVGMYGYSRGAVMTYLALTRTPRVKAAIVVGALADLRTDQRRRKELNLPAHDIEDFCLRQLLPNYDQNREKELDARAPVKQAAKMNRSTPILILHGASDWAALAYEGLDMAAELLRLKHPFRLVMFEGGDHGLDLYMPEVDRLTKDWLDRYVRDGQTWPTLEPKAH